MERQRQVPEPGPVFFARCEKPSLYRSACGSTPRSVSPTFFASIEPIPRRSTYDRARSRWARCTARVVPARPADGISPGTGTGSACSAGLPPALHAGDRATTFEKKSPIYGTLQSPLTDSNRRPPPYHGGFKLRLCDAEKSLGCALFLQVGWFRSSLHPSLERPWASPKSSNPSPERRNQPGSLVSVTRYVPGGACMRSRAALAPAVSMWMVGGCGGVR